MIQITSTIGMKLSKRKAEETSLSEKWAYDFLEIE